MVHCFPIVGEHVVSGKVVLTVCDSYALSTSCRNADTTTDEVYDATAPVKECIFVVTETESDGTELMR